MLLITILMGNAQGLPAQQLLDFDLLKSSAYQQFRAFEENAGSRNFNSLFSYAEILLHAAAKDEYAEVLKALRGIVDAGPPNRAEVALANAWIGMFDLNDRIEAAAAARDKLSISKTSPTNDGPELTANSNIGTGVLDAARSAIRKERARLTDMPRSSFRESLELQLALDSALVSDFAGDRKAAIDTLQPFLSVHTWTARTSPFFLTAVYLLTTLESLSKTGNEVILIHQVEMASDVVRKFWSRHPVLASADDTITTLAVTGHIRTDGLRALNRLWGSTDLKSPDPASWQSRATAAFELGDIAAGLAWLKASLLAMVTNYDLNSDEWRDFVRSSLDGEEIFDNPVHKGLMISGLIGDTDLIPKGSPIARWALFELAQSFDDTGSIALALSLRKQAAALPIGDRAAALLMPTTTISELERAELDTDFDPAIKGQFSEALFERYRSSGDFEKASLQLQILIDRRVAMVGAKELDRYIEPFIQSLIDNESPMAPISSDSILDGSMLSRQASLESLSMKLRTIGSYGPAAMVDDALWKQRTDRLDQRIAVALRSDTGLSFILVDFESAAKELASLGRPRTALRLYTEHLGPMLFITSEAPAEWHGSDTSRLFSSFAKALAMVGLTTMERRLVFEAQQYERIKERIPRLSVCRRLATILKGAEPNQFSENLKEVIRWPCEQGRLDALQAGTTGGPTVGTNWEKEERRLRSLPKTAPPLKSHDRGTTTCSLDAASTEDFDSFRIALLRELDGSRQLTPRNAFAEAALLERLAATYSITDTEAPLDLRQRALKLLIEETVGSRDQVIHASQCIVRDLVRTSRGEDAKNFVRQTIQRLSEHDNAPAGEQLLAAARTDFPELSAPAVEVAQTGDELSRLMSSVSRLRGTGLRQEVLTQIPQLRGYVTATNPRESIEPKLSSLVGSVERLAGIDSDLVGALSVLTAEEAFLRGNFNVALGWVDKAVNTVKHGPWQEPALFPEAQRLKVFQEYARRIREKRVRVSQLVNRWRSLERANAKPEELATLLSTVMEQASKASEYSTLILAAKALATIKVDFFSRDAFMARESLSGNSLENLIASCTQDPFQQPIAECRRAAIRLAAIIATDALTKDQTEKVGPKQDNEKTDARIISVTRAIAPLMGPNTTSLQSDLSQLLSWTIAERRPPVGSAAQDQIDYRIGLAKFPEIQVRLRAWRNIASKWMQAEAQLHCAERVGESGDVLAQLKKDTIDDHDSAMSAWLDVTKTLPDGVSLPTIANFDVSELRRSLAAEEAILSYTVDSDDVFIWVVRKDQIDLRMSKAPKLLATVQRFSDQLIKHGPTSGKEFLQLDDSRELYDELISPIESLIQDVHTLYVDPDSSVVRVPFGALIAKTPTEIAWSSDMDWTPDWLASRYSIAIVPSLAAFVAARHSAARPPGNVLAAGDPRVGIGVPDQADWCRSTEVALPGAAPGAEEELNDVVQLAGSHATLLSGANFTGDKLYNSDLSRYGLVVFATHAEPETVSEPARLVLSGSERPSFLTATDIDRMTFDADLVVLSACNSGLRGDGRAGLNTLVPALLRAGARLIVATSWPIEQETARAMTLPLTDYYLSNGTRDLHITLHVAIEKMIRGTSGSTLRHPHYWAGLILVGIPPLGK